jgi:hypothetical protein
MNPKPFIALNHFTVPVAMARSLQIGRRTYLSPYSLQGLGDRLAAPKGCRMQLVTSPVIRPAPPSAIRYQSLSARNRATLKPNASHAIEVGKISARANTPPPTMKFRGACSLNRKSSPGLTALKFVRPPGCQKFTSSAIGLLSPKHFAALAVENAQSYCAQRPGDIRGGDDC